jgi:tetratricopeptide (TPR) repeat protein
MFSDQSPNRQRWSKGRIVWLVTGLILVNVVFVWWRPFNNNSCNSPFASGYDRGVALDLYGDRAAAVAAYSEELKRNPQNVEALKNRGTDYTELGKFDLAVADLTAALKLAPKDWDAMVDRARAYLKLGKFDLAIADLTQAVQVQPGIWSNWNQRGDAYLAHGDLDLAIADYTQSLAAGEAYHVDVSYYPRGIAYLRAGKFDLAQADFAAYLAAHPAAAEAAKGRDCAAARSNGGDCAIQYPAPPDPAITKLLDAGARSLSGCDQD